MRARRWSAAVVALLSAVSLAACSQDTSGKPALSGLAQAMDSVSGSGPARTQFGYGNLARLRELGALRPHAAKHRVVGQWINIVGIGAGQFTQVAFVLQQPTGITPFDYDTAVTVMGRPPNTATKFTGDVAKATITAKLKKAGAKPRTYGSTNGLSLRPDNKVDLNNVLVPGLVNNLNQVAITDHTLAASPNAATLRAVLGGKKSLLDTGKYQQVADCLGDVVAAMIITPRRAPNAKIVAVGMRNPGSLRATQHEVVCVLPAHGKKAAVHDAMSARLTPSAPEPRSRQPLSTWFSAISVTNDGDLVQAILTHQPHQPVGFVFQALLNQAFSYWLGD